MRKKILTLVAMATLVTMMTACGNSETTNTSTTPTTAPTVTIEPTVEPAESEVTVEPTTEPTVEPTATSTPTPEPTEAPEETDGGYGTSYSTHYVEPNYNPQPAVPVGGEDNTSADFGTIVDELEWSYSFKDSVQYIETLDQSRYKANAENNFDLLFEMGLLQGEKDATLDAIFNPENWSYVEVEKEIQMEGWTDTMWVSISGNPTGEYYLWTLTDTTTGEVIPWGVLVYLEDSVNAGMYYEATFTCRDFVTFKVPELSELTETPVESTEASSIEVDDASNFAMLKDMIFTASYLDGGYYSYGETASIIETMDESRYVVTAVEGLSPVLKESLTDAQKQSVLDALFADSYDFWGEYPVEKVDKWGRTCEVRYPATPTGEFYTMTLTDTVTGETFAWGFRVHVEANDEPGTYYVLEDGIFSILYLAQQHWSWGHTNYTGCAKDYTDVFDEKYYIYSR